MELSVYFTLKCKARHKQWTIVPIDSRADLNKFGAIYRVARRIAFCLWWGNGHSFCIVRLTAINNETKYAVQSEKGWCLEVSAGQFCAVVTEYGKDSVFVKYFFAVWIQSSCEDIFIRFLTREWKKWRLNSNLFKLGENIGKILVLDYFVLSFFLMLIPMATKQEKSKILLLPT